MKYYLLLFVSFLGIIIFFSGCVSYSTLQSAETLSPGKVLLGGASSFPVTDKDIQISPELNTRVGIFKHFDIGAKYSAPAVIFLDGKFQILDKPFNLSADLGWSYFSYSGTIGNSKGTFSAWYPMIIAGQKHWYVAVKEIYYILRGEFDLVGLYKYSGSGWLTTNLTFGGIIGTNVRLLPELNIVLPTKGKVLFVPALGLQFVL